MLELLLELLLQFFLAGAWVLAWLLIFAGLGVVFVERERRRAARKRFFGTAAHKPSQPVTRQFLRPKKEALAANDKQ